MSVDKSCKVLQRRKNLLIMRPKLCVYKHYKKTETTSKGQRFECKYCNASFMQNATRMKDHIDNRCPRYHLERKKSFDLQKTLNEAFVVEDSEDALSDILPAESTSRADTSTPSQDSECDHISASQRTLPQSPPSR